MTLSEPKQAYKLKFIPEALVEWKDLDGSVKEIMRKALKKRLANPHVPGSELHSELNFCYKIKLKKQGYRLVYYVEDNELVVVVIAIDKRENLTVYKSALKRLQELI